MTTCAGTGGSSSFVPSGTLVGQPEDPNVAIGTSLTPGGGLIAIYDIEVAVPAGLPAYSMVIQADVSTSSGAAGANGLLQMQITDLFNGVETLLAQRSITAEPDQLQQVFGQVSQNNLAAGTHRIRLLARQTLALGPTLTVAQASLVINLVRQLSFVLAAPE